MNTLIHIVLITALLILLCLCYIDHVYSNASNGILKFANKINSQSISMSFMIPQTYWD